MQGIGNLGKKSLVDFKSTKAFENAYPMILPGDILEDLPEVSNFTHAE